MPRGSIPRRLVGGLVKLAGGLIVGAIALELVLQIGAFAMRATGRPDPGIFISDRHRVLTLGDSNTYGLYLEPAESYPEVFEQRWNADAARRPIEVLNLGFPGTNASKVRRDISRLLRTVRPDTVLLMIGANDYWTVRSEAASDESWGSRAMQLAWTHSRLYRLLFIARRAVASDPELEVEVHSMDAWHRGSGEARFGDETFELGWAERSDPSTPAGVIAQESRADLLAIADAVRGAGVHLVLVTYPSEALIYGMANHRMRTFARENGLDLVDLGTRFRAECPDPCATLFFPDQHPNAAGHARAAELLVDALAGRGGL